MKRLILILNLAGAFAGFALGASILFAVADNYVLVWTDGGPRWAKIGSGLVYQNGVLSAVLPSLPPPRAYDVKLTWDGAASGWRFPSTSAPTGVVCAANGQTYHQGEDYTVTGNLLVPNTAGGNWPTPLPTGYTVVCSYNP